MAPLKPQQGTLEERRRSSRCSGCDRPITPKLLAAHVSKDGQHHCNRCWNRLPKWARRKETR